MKIVTLMITLMLAFNVSAETTVGGYAACTSENTYDEYITASIKGDDTALRYLSRSCLILKKGLHVSVLDRTWTGTVKIRAYAGNDTIVLWTAMENVK